MQVRRRIDVLIASFVDDYVQLIMSRSGFLGSSYLSALRISEIIHKSTLQ